VDFNHPQLVLTQPLHPRVRKTQPEPAVARGDVVLCRICQSGIELFYEVWVHLKLKARFSKTNCSGWRNSCSGIQGPNLKVGVLILYASILKSDSFSDGSVRSFCSCRGEKWRNSTTPT